MTNKFLILSMALVTLLASCRKERRDTIGSSISTDHNTAENLVSDMFKVVNDVAGNVHCNEKDLEDEVEYVG